MTRELRRRGGDVRTKTLRGRADGSTRPRERRLEVNAESKLHVAGSVGLRGDSAEQRGRAQAEAGVAELDVVQDIRDLEAEGCTDAAFFPDADIFEGACVDVPGRLAANVSSAAATGVITEDARTEFGVDQRRILELIHSNWIIRANSICPGHVVFGAAASGVGRGKHSVLGKGTGAGGT